KDIGEKCDSLRLCSFATLRETLCVLCVWSGSLKKDVGKLKRCDSVRGSVPEGTSAPQESLYSDKL
ncbi:MAG: hypothetical protein ACK5OU_14625, partial [Dolichospermum sp.]